MAAMSFFSASNFKTAGGTGAGTGAAAGASCWATCALSGLAALGGSAGAGAAGWAAWARDSNSFFVASAIATICSCNAGGKSDEPAAWRKSLKRAFNSSGESSESGRFSPKTAASSGGKVARSTAACACAGGACSARVGRKRATPRRLAASFNFILSSLHDCRIKSAAALVLFTGSPRTRAKFRQ